MERASVRTEATGAVTTIILDRPDRRNAIDRPTGKALAAAFRAFERDADARVAVLWGANGTFCAGADLKAVAADPPRRRIRYGDGPMGPTRMRLSKPVIAAVAGYAVAGGFELALWGDLRVVEEDAVMGVFNRRWGIPLIDGGTVRLPALVGLGRALAARPHAPRKAPAGRPRAARRGPWRGGGVSPPVQSASPGSPATGYDEAGSGAAAGRERPPRPQRPRRLAFGLARSDLFQKR